MPNTTSRLRAALVTAVPITALILAAGCGGDKSGTAAESTFCSALRRADVATGPVSSGELPPDRMKEGIAKARAALADVASSDGSPAQVSADATTLEQEMERLDALVAQHGYDMSQVPEDAFTAAGLGGAEVQHAGQRLEQVRADTCGAGG